MKALLIDTATEKGLIGITENDRVIASQPLPPGFDQSKFLVPALHRLLHEYSIDLASVDCIATGIGPGSYTGIRIGVSAAKALAYALQLPLIGISSLFFFTPAHKDISFATVIDAKIGGAYFFTGRIDTNGIISRMCEPQVASLDQLGQYIKDATLIVSPAIHSLKTKMDRLYPTDHMHWEEIPPSASYPALLVQSKYATQEWSPDGRLELLYLRKTEAELQKERKKT